MQCCFANYGNSSLCQQNQDVDDKHAHIELSLSTKMISTCRQK